MTKKKRRRKRRPGTRRRSADRLGAVSRLLPTFEEADRLLELGEPKAALDLLEPLAEEHPQIGKLHWYIAVARTEMGDDWRALDSLQRAAQLGNHAEDWLVMAGACLELQMTAHALRAFRKGLSLEPNAPWSADIREIVAGVEEGMGALARHVGIPDRQAERGLRAMNDGQRALHRNDYSGAISGSQRAARLLPGWPPPLNNLSLGQFYDGRPEEAIGTARRVLAREPDNIHALANAIRFLAWAGDREDAAELWPRLQDLEPEDESDRWQIIEAGAIAEDDEAVYRLLKPLDSMVDGDQRADVRGRLFLAVAEANTGRVRAAMRRLRGLSEIGPWADRLLEALEAGRPGPGWAQRFPYFSSAELIPLAVIDRYAHLGERPGDDLPQFESIAAEIAKRYPQIVLMAAKVIWEECSPAAGVQILGDVGTPAALAALRRYGLSDAGTDRDRMHALGELMRAGEIADGETCHVWLQGEWRDVEMHINEIEGGPAVEYAPEVLALLHNAEIAMLNDDLDEAERLFKQVVAAEPDAIGAYNNLGVIRMRREDYEGGQEMFEAALALDPMYVFARGSLALIQLDRHDVAGAREVLAPLGDGSELEDLEKAYLNTTLGRIAVIDGDLEQARAHALDALASEPGYEQALNLLDIIEDEEWYEAAYQDILDYRRRRWLVKRRKAQRTITTAAPTLSEALSVYTKGALTGMARLLPVSRGWSTLRKAELRLWIEEALREPFLMERVTAWMPEDQRAALREVLAQGGSMLWDEFDDRFGNDLDESPHWDDFAPVTTMGLLRARGMLAEASVDEDVLVTIPVEMRVPLEKLLRE